MKSAKQWKSFYADERRKLGVAELERLIEASSELKIAPSATQPGGAIVFPHTRLSATGLHTAAAARAILESGCETVLALGVLHGAREQDADVVARARAGESSAVTELRRVHGPRVMGDDGRWSEEFSLDNFVALVELAAIVLGKRLPRIFARYPFLVGDDPRSLPGFDELQYLVDHGAAIVATTDPVHHGAGYDTAPERLLRNGEAAQSIAREWITLQLEQLRQKDYRAFQMTCATVKSDFRDVGPVLAELVPVRSYEFVDLKLVDYGDVLNTADPTWVAAALLTITSR